MLISEEFFEHTISNNIHFACTHIYTTKLHIYGMSHPRSIRFSSYFINKLKQNIIIKYFRP